MQNFIRVRRFSRRRTKLLKRVPPSLTHGGSRHALPILRPSGAPPFTRSSFVGRCRAPRRRRRGTSGWDPTALRRRKREAPLPPRSGRFFSLRTVATKAVVVVGVASSTDASSHVRVEERRLDALCVRLLGGRERGARARSDSRVWETAAALARMGTHSRRAVRS